MTILYQPRTDELTKPAGWLGQRFDRIEYELLDRAGNRIGKIDPGTESVPTISANTDQAIMRTLSGLEFVGRERQDIDINADRLRPVAVLENGDRFPLGLFLFGEYQREPWSPKLYDQGLILAGPVGRTVTLDVGASISQAIINLLEEVGIVRHSVEGAATITGEPYARPGGTAREAIITELAAMMGCPRGFFDNDGEFLTRPAPDPGSVRPRFTYGPGSIVAQSILETDESYKAPNRYVRIGASSTTPIIGVFDIPAIAPHSIANRGYIVADVLDLPAIQDQGAAAQAAQAAYLADARSWQTLHFESLLNPEADLYDVVRYEHDAETSGLYVETGFSMQLRYDGAHTHDLARLW